MIKKTIACLCDICGKEDAKTYHVLTYRTFDSTDGQSRYNPPQLRVESIDLCYDCAIKSTNIHSVGVQCDEYEIVTQKNMEG